MYKVRYKLVTYIPSISVLGHNTSVSIQLEIYSVVYMMLGIQTTIAI